MEARGGAGEANGARSTGLAGHRAILLIGTSLLATLPSAAFAQNECGAPPPGGGTVTCTTAGNPYAGGIEYAPVEDLTVVLEPGVIVDEGITVTSGTPGVDIRIEGGTDTQISSTESGTPNDGVHVTSNGTSFIEVDDVSTTGDSSNGIFGAGFAGSTVIADTVSTTGDSSAGIFAASGATKYAGGDVSVTVNSVTTTGANAIGIDATSVGGKYSSGGNITITSGDVQTSGDGATGIDATSIGGLKYGDGGTITIVSGTVETSGDNAVGINAASGGGIKYGDGGSAVTVTSESVVTAGDNSTGIRATSGNGDVTITSGSVTTGGEYSDGIVAVSGSGSVLVDAGDVDVSGAYSDAVVVTSDTSSTVIVRGLVEATDGVEVQAEGAAASVQVKGSGTIRGAIDLTDNADSVTNGGTFDAIGDSLFGEGDDVFDNTGTMRVVNGPVTMVGLEQFNNLGTIDMRDGAANDSLTVDGYHAGSVLGIDVDFEAGVADLLNTGLATGETTIEVQPVGELLFQTDGILVVDAGPGTTASAFTAAPIGSPYVRGVLEFDAANQDFYLLTLPDQAVFETAQVAGLSTNLWYESADALVAKLDSARDGLGTGHAEARGTGLWMQVWTDETDIDGSDSFSDGGFSDTFDISYERDFTGFQGGIDMRLGQAVVGITAGWGDAELEFDASGNTLEADVMNLGVYGEFRSGSFFVNGLGKFDWLDIETDPGAGAGAEFDASVHGAQLNGGFRWGSGGGFYAEPSIGIAWVGADIDSYESALATVDFEGADSVRGRAGLRVGGAFASGATTIAPFAGLHVYKEFAGDNRTTFSIGNALELGDDVPETYGDAQAGLSITHGNADVFFRGELGFGEDYDSKSVRAGLRIRL